jgi:hypothetical protein
MGRLSAALEVGAALELGDTLCSDLVQRLVRRSNLGHYSGNTGSASVTSQRGTRWECRWRTRRRTVCGTTLGVGWVTILGIALGAGLWSNRPTSAEAW